MYYVLVPRSIERRNQLLLTDISVMLEVELLSCLSSPTLASSYMNYVLVPRSIETGGINCWLISQSR